MTSAGRRRKSRKRSAAKRRQRRPSTSPLIFYVDECLGTYVPQAIAAAGFTVRPWYDHFPGKEDVEWLPAVGANGWILLTKDKEIRRRPIEVEAILNSRLRAFVLVTTGAMTREAIAAILLGAMRKIHRICKRPGPFVFNITTAGHISQVPARTLNRRARRRPPE